MAFNIYNPFDAGSREAIKKGFKTVASALPIVSKIGQYSPNPVTSNLSKGFNVAYKAASTPPPSPMVTRPTPSPNMPTNPMSLMSIGGQGTPTKTSTMPIAPQPVPTSTSQIRPTPAAAAPQPIAPQTTTNGGVINPRTGGVSAPSPVMSAPAMPGPAQNSPTMPMASQLSLANEPTNQPAQPTLPSAPATPPSDFGLSEAERTYQSNLQMSPEEEATAGELANLEQSYKTGYLDAEGKPIPLNFITGQQRLLEARKLALAEPLQSKLARLQAKRQSSLEASKFALERADRAAAASRESNKPLEVGGNLVRLNPETGQYETVFSAPGKSAEGFTLGEGQARYDAQGNLIAGREKGVEQLTPYQAAQLNIAQQRLNQSQNQQKALSAESTKLVNNSLSALDDIAKIRQQVNSQFGSGRFLDADYKAAENNVVDVIGRLRSGGAISDDEAKRFQALLPSLLESDATRNNKLDRLEKLLHGVVDDIKLRSGGGGGEDSGGDALDMALDQAGFKRVGSGTANARKVAQAIGQFESGGRYNALGPVVTSGQYRGERALGKYQVMPGNVASWTREALGRSLTPQQFLNSPQAQDAVAEHRMGKLLQQYGNVEDVASVWFSGRPVKKAGNVRDVLNTSVPQYVKNVRSIYNNLG